VVAPVYASGNTSGRDAKLTIYAANGSGNVKRLKGAGGCRLRIGDRRVIFIEDARSITVNAGNRREIYD
jgi:mRNA interferase RelE/StbE